MYSKVQILTNGIKRILLKLLKPTCSKCINTSYSINHDNVIIVNEIMMNYNQMESNDKPVNCKQINVKLLLKIRKYDKNYETKDNFNKDDKKPKNIIIKKCKYSENIKVSNKNDNDGEIPIYKYVNVVVKMENTLNMDNVQNVNGNKPIYKYINDKISVKRLIKYIKNVIKINVILNNIKCKCIDCEMDENCRYNLDDTIHLGEFNAVFILIMVKVYGFMNIYLYLIFMVQKYFIKQNVHELMNKYLNLYLVVSNKMTNKIMLLLMGSVYGK
eukprot:409168_1